MKRKWNERSPKLTPNFILLPIELGVLRFLREHMLNKRNQVYLLNAFMSSTSLSFSLSDISPSFKFIKAREVLLNCFQASWEILYFQNYDIFNNLQLSILLLRSSDHVTFFFCSFPFPQFQLMSSTSLFLCSLVHSFAFLSSSGHS